MNGDANDIDVIQEPVVSGRGDTKQWALLQKTLITLVYWSIASFFVLRHFPVLYSLIPGVNNIVVPDC